MKNGYEVIGESADDNISGMHFNREGINKIYEAVEEKMIDAVIVKDLSRLGRHRTQTALFIDFLRENDVKVLSVTENIDTSNEDDELMIGFKGIFNDMYARDISKKIRAGYLQKQKQGIVMIPPFGYYKDKNTGEVVIIEECAEIVRKIYSLYLEGYGIKNIAKYLNEQKIKSPSYYQKKYLNKKQGYHKPEITSRGLWEHTAVKRVLENEFYAGTLVCHQSYTNKINKVRKQLPPEEHFRQENAVPAIISREVWEQVQFLLEEKQKNNVRASTDKPFHRYTGLLRCGDCGATFACKTRYWKDKTPRYEYCCNSYHRYGKEHCTSHRIDEKEIDEIIYKELKDIIKFSKENFSKCDHKLKQWMASKSKVDKKIMALEQKLKLKKEDQQGILLERIRDKEHAEIYTEMLLACENEIAQTQYKIEELKRIDETVKKRRKEMKTSIEMLEEIIEDGSISDTNLRMFIEKIIIFEKDGKLDLQLNLNGQFPYHIDYFDENGTMINKHQEGWWYDSETWGMDVDNEYWDEVVMQEV
jgi:DNA invertase Pin-like site-specific DNA recombinase/uncharacterized protein (UPF0147 family)